MDMGWGEEAANLLQKTVRIEERNGADELQAESTQCQWLSGSDWTEYLLREICYII